MFSSLSFKISERHIAESGGSGCCEA